MQIKMHAKFAPVFDPVYVCVRFYMPVPAPKTILCIVGKFERNTWWWFAMENRALALKLSHNREHTHRESVCNVVCVFLVYGQVRVHTNEACDLWNENMFSWIHASTDSLLAFVLLFPTCSAGIFHSVFFLCFSCVFFLCVWCALCMFVYYFKLTRWLDLGLRWYECVSWSYWLSNKC